MSMVAFARFFKVKIILPKYFFQLWGKIRHDPTRQQA
jgi:hypothetical protein